ncbi:hypothetical protein O7626_13380 [Micromonospora sp. WMMD1102]|nr:hypothetical protein [Micromonospora sp. WMMD1102]MDG4786910.1 hypothetical protein [Micromonospora sp. WMMD1102]
MMLSPRFVSPLQVPLLDEVPSADHGGHRHVAQEPALGEILGIPVNA